MLRTDLLTLTASNAVRCLPIIYGVYIVVIIIRIPVIKDLLCIQACKQVGNGYLFRTAIRTIAAGRARNHILGLENLAAKRMA